MKKGAFDQDTEFTCHCINSFSLYVCLPIPADGNKKKLKNPFIETFPTQT